MRLQQIAGIAHAPAGVPAGVVLLTHGAGGSRESPLLVRTCDEWARRGWLAVRYNLPFRRRRPTGPPSGSARADQAGVAEAITLAHALADGPVIAGGISYGGRLTSMAVAEEPGTVAALTLFSYPLHPPGKPERLRTGHFGAITAPTVFVHGVSDPFGSIAELHDAVALIPAVTEVVEVPRVGHDLGFSAKGTKVPDVPATAVDAALRRSALG